MWTATKLNDGAAKEYGFGWHTTKIGIAASSITAARGRVLSHISRAFPMIN